MENILGGSRPLGSIRRAPEKRNRAMRWYEVGGRKSPAGGSERSSPARILPGTLLCLCFLQSAIAGAGGWHYFRWFGAADGLSQAVVQAIHQDREGYLWIGTQAGLNRYDGTAFTVYGIRQGLVHDWVNAIAEDSEGRLWVATLGGVSYFDGARFHSFTVLDGLPHSHVHSLAIDSNGGVWCATSEGLAQFDGTQWRIHGEAEGIPSPGTRALLRQRSGRLWVGTDQGLVYLTEEGFRQFDPQGLSGRAVRALAEDERGRLWVALPSSVRVYDGEHLDESHDFGQRLSSPLTALLLDRFGYAWIGTPDGLAVLDGSRLRVLNRPHGLRYPDIRTLHEDREGVLWIGTMGGLSKLQGRAFTNYGVEQGLGSEVVRPILRDGRGVLWVGTTGGLSSLEGRTWRNYTVDDGLADNAVLSLLEDPSGRLWIGTRAGLTVLENGRFSHLAAVPRGRVVSLAREFSGTLWVALQPEGLLQIVKGNAIAVDVPGQSFSNARFLIDGRDRLWVSGDRGLSLWDGRRWRTYTVTEGLAENQPYFLCEDASGAIWFGYHSSHGVSRFDGTSFRHFTTAHGLTNDAVYSMGVDGRGSLWIGTARGVDRFDGTTFVNYGTGEGFANDESNAGGFFADRDGTLWFGTMGGLSHYDPRFDLTGGDPPVVRFSRIRLGDHWFSAEASPEVAYRHNDLTVQAAALSFVNERRVTLEYRLQGFDGAWTPLTFSELRITNLPARDYRLEVRGRKHATGWSEPIEFVFSIQPAFWQTWWWWGLIGGLLAAGSLLGFRIQTARVRRRSEQLEGLVMERTRELEETNQELESFIYTVSHDLKAPVISLQGMASLLQEELGGDVSNEAALYLSRIQSNTRRMQQLIGELLELSRIGRLAQPRERIRMGRLVEKAIEEVQGQITLRGARVEVADDLPDVVCEPSRLIQVWSNLLANALNYSRPGIPPHVRIGTGAKENGDYLFHIRDNGVGLRPEYLQKVFDIFYRVDGKYEGESTGVGLAIVKRVIATHKGRVWAESEGEGKGSTFWFTLPAPGDSEATSSGRDYRGHAEDPVG